MQVDRDAPLRFLRAAFMPEDWIAVLLKRHDTGEAVQRVGPVAMVLDARFQSWLRFKNARRFDVFVSINALTPGRRSRTRESVTAVRHVFLDADKEVDRVLRQIEHRSDLPTPSFIVRSSKGRAHVLWRVDGMPVQRVEKLQKHLARELGTDMAATSAAQMTRLPGFLNHKYVPPPLVVATATAAAGQHLRTSDFQRVSEQDSVVAERMRAARGQRPDTRPGSPLARAKRYLAAIPPAIQGQGGDARTFRTCLKLVDTFGLTQESAMELLADWNAHCQPPWSESQLLAKLRSARRCRRQALDSTQPGVSPGVDRQGER